MRKFSLAYLTMPGTDPVTQIRIASKCGYDYVSLRTIPLGLPGEPEYLLHRDQRLFSDVKKALSDYGLSILDIELARIREDLNTDLYEPEFEKAAELGARAVLGSVWSRDVSFYQKGVAKVADMAAKYGLSYHVEFLTWAGIRNLKEDVALIDSLQRPNLYCMIDTLHAHRSRVTPNEVLACSKKYFGMMHLCDGPAEIPDSIDHPDMFRVAREAREYAGMGGIDIAGYVNALPGIPLSIELPNLKLMEQYGAEGHAKMCLETAKAYLTNHAVS